MSHVGSQHRFPHRICHACTKFADTIEYYVSFCTKIFTEEAKKITAAETATIMLLFHVMKDYHRFIEPVFYFVWFACYCYVAAVTAAAAKAAHTNNKKPK